MPLLKGEVDLPHTEYNNYLQLSTCQITPKIIEETQFNDTVFSILSENCSKMQYLEISRNRQIVTDSSVISIFDINWFLRMHSNITGEYLRFIQNFSKICSYTESTVSNYIIESKYDERLVQVFNYLDLSNKNNKMVYKKYKKHLKSISKQDRPLLMGVYHKKSVYLLINLGPRELTEILEMKSKLIKRLVKKESKWANYLLQNKNCSFIDRLIKYTEKTNFKWNFDPVSIPTAKHSLFHIKQNKLSDYQPLLSFSHILPSLKLLPNYSFGQFINEDYIPNSNADMNWIYLAFSETLLKQSISYSSNISINNSNMSSIDCIEKTHLIYDPLYLLPLLLFTLRNSLIDSIKFMRYGFIGYILSFLSNSEDKIRIIAYKCMPYILSLYEQTNSIYKDQLIFFFNLLKNSISENSQILPAIVLNILIEILNYLLMPSHSLYPVFNSFLLSKPLLDFTDLPLFYDLFNSTNEHYKSNRNWILNGILSGMQTNKDFKITSRRHIFPVMFCYFESSIADSNSRFLCLKILYRAFDVSENITDLFYGGCLIPFLNGVVLSTNRSVTFLYSIITIIENGIEKMNDLVKRDIIVIINSIINRIRILEVSWINFINGLYKLSFILLKLNKKINKHLIFDTIQLVVKYKNCVDTNKDVNMGKDELIELWKNNLNDSNPIETVTINILKSINNLKIKSIKETEISLMFHSCFVLYSEVCDRKSKRIEQEIFSFIVKIIENNYLNNIDINEFNCMCFNFTQDKRKSIKKKYSKLPLENQKINLLF